MTNRAGTFATMVIATDERGQRARSPLHSSGPALVIWAGLVISGALTAAALTLVGDRISIDAPPLHAMFDPILRPLMALPVVVATVAVFALPTCARRASWRTLLVGAAVGSAAFGLSLASARGWSRVVDPVLGSREYLAVLPRIGDLGAFLATFTSRIGSYPVHVQGHPPGTVVLATALRDVGLGGPGWFAAVLIAGGAVVAPAVLIVVRDVADERWARRAMPYLVIGPAAVWMVTSADALFAGLGAVGVAWVVLATGRGDRRGDAMAFAGGVVLGLAVFFSYALVLLGLVPLVVAWRRGRARPIVIAAIAAALVVAMFLAFGFWWLDGLAATREQYVAGIASRRSYIPFAVIDLAAFGIVVGPATVVGMARLRSARMWMLVGAGLAAVAVAIVSGMAKGEVERIWLPFAPWVIVAAAASSRPKAHATSGSPVDAHGSDVPGGVARWIAAQAAVAILVESLVRTPW